MDEINHFASEEKARSSRRKGARKSLKAKNGSAKKKSKNKAVKSAAGAAVIKIGKSIKAIESEYRRKLPEAIGKLYGEARSLSSDHHAWEEFRADKRLWKARKPPKPDADILREVIKLAVPNSDRSSFYYRVVKLLFDANIPADKVPAAIRKGGGLQAMADKYAEDRRLKRSGTEERRTDLERPKKPKLKAKFDIPEDDLQGLPDECDVILHGTLRRSESGKYEFSISTAVNVS